MERRYSMAEWLAERFIPGLSDEHRAPVDLRSFRAHGHAAARVLGGRFIDEPPRSECRSHDSALFVLRDATTRVLLHHELPLLAFTVHDSDRGCLYEFIDAPHLARALGEAFVVVSKRVLDAPCDLLELERAVGKDDDLRYWAPRSLGEILYNFWD
jgi:hypothetical protein